MWFRAESPRFAISWGKQFYMVKLARYNNAIVATIGLSRSDKGILNPKTFSFDQMCEIWHYFCGREASKIDLKLALLGKGK